MRLNILYFIALTWVSLSALFLAWPLSWHAAPVLLCWGYVVFRLVFEATFNRANIPTLATCRAARRKVADILAREAAKSGKEAYQILDVGSGRGEMARQIAKKIPKAKVKGVEWSRIALTQAALVQRLFGPENLAYERCDFWTFDCSSMDAVFLYLGPKTTPRMGEKLRRELKSGSFVVAYAFPLLGAWVPQEVVTFRSPFKETIYVYRFFQQA